MTIEKLYQTLKQLKRPEDVAEMILELLNNELSPKEKGFLQKIKEPSLKRIIEKYASLHQKFGEDKGIKEEIQRAINIFELEIEETADEDEGRVIDNFIKNVSNHIYKEFGQNNFKENRLNKEEREILDLAISKRKYNKKWRLLQRLEKKLRRYQKKFGEVEFKEVMEKGIFHSLSFEEFSTDLNIACFIAYYNARINLKNIFSEHQIKAFDNTSNMLLTRCMPRREEIIILFTAKEHRSPIDKNSWEIWGIYKRGEIFKKIADKEEKQLQFISTKKLKRIIRLLAKLGIIINLKKRRIID